MIHRCIHEWEYLNVGTDGSDNVVSRVMADDLVKAARASRIGGADGENVLINGHRRLRAQQVVGVLATPTVTLEILPKIDGLDDGATRQQLVHMLARVYDLDISSGEITALDWQSRDLLEIVIRIFCDQLFAAVHRGLPRRYVEHEDDLPALRGGLNVVRQFSILAATPQKLACRYDDLTPDIPLNQIMKAAVRRLRSISRATENQRRLAELSYAFADISTVPVPALPWNRVILNRTNRAWERLIAFAKLVLGERFQTTSAGDLGGFSLLFEINTLFEEYVGRVLRRALAAHPLDVRLQGPRNHVLVAEDNTRRFATKPDISINCAGHPQLIIDTKWKKLSLGRKWGVGQADVYQMMAYAQVYQCNQLILLYPHHSELGGGEGILETFRIAGRDDTHLHVASVSLCNLTNIESRLMKLVSGKLSVLSGNLTQVA